MHGYAPVATEQSPNLTIAPIGTLEGDERKGVFFTRPTGH